MFFRLALLFILVPLLELVLLVEISRQTSLPFTLGLVVCTGILGAWLARREGIACLGRVRADLAAGRMPADSLVDGLMILVAGALLLTPGVLTDLVGFGLLARPVRGYLKRFLATRFRARFVVAHFGETQGMNEEVIDVESRHVDPPRHGPNRSP